MTHNPFFERAYFGELPRLPRGAFDPAEDARNRAEDRAELEAAALTLYRAAFWAASGDDDDRHNAGASVLMASYPKDWLDLHEHCSPALDAEWNAKKAAA